MKYSNIFIFIISLSVLIFLQSYNHVSTSLLSILPAGEPKELIKAFEKTQNNKILLLAVKGFDVHALETIRQLDKDLTSLPLLSKKQMNGNSELQKHQELYKLFIHEIDKEKLSELNVSKALKELYTEMTTSFFPVNIDKIDPFKLLTTSEISTFKLKNGHLVLGDYGYLSVFSLNSATLDEHKELYHQIHTIVGNKRGVKLFSPLFYYVENSQAITSDVNNIIFIAMSILLLLYLFILRDISLLINTVTTLLTSAIVSTIIITQIYNEVSIFVFVFGISISTVAIDYMFHHYVHGYYLKNKSYNQEVLFGFLTTITTFFILSFTSFLLIKQIAIFAIISLIISYLHFAFLYPKIGFNQFRIQKNTPYDNLNFINVKMLFIVSIIIVIFSPLWIDFDLNLKNLDYDNRSLSKTEQFFVKQLNTDDTMTFALKSESIDKLITNAQTIKEDVASANIPISSLISRKSYERNKAILESISLLKEELNAEAKKLGFIKEYFKNAYEPNRPFMNYTEEDIKMYGIDIVRMNSSYITYGTVKNKELYQRILTYDFVESLSLKERFEVSMKTSMNQLLKLSIVALIIIVILLYIFTKSALPYAMLFLIFPVSMVSLYAYFTSINILHVFMLVILLSLSIDYAIYLSKKNDNLTKKAIAYSLISTFAGFGVLIFSSINALYSLGIVATIGIVSITILLVFVKRVDNVS